MEKNVAIKQSKLCKLRVMNDCGERIPIEVIARFTERGEMRPLKLNFGDRIYNIDKIYNRSLTTPKGAFGVALEYKCLIDGRRRSIFFDRYENVWFVMKEDKQKRKLPQYNPLNYDIYED